MNANRRSAAPFPLFNPPASLPSGSARCSARFISIDIDFKLDEARCSARCPDDRGSYLGRSAEFPRCPPPFDFHPRVFDSVLLWSILAKLESPNFNPLPSNDWKPSSSCFRVFVSPSLHVFVSSCLRVFKREDGRVKWPIDILVTEDASKEAKSYRIVSSESPGRTLLRLRRSDSSVTSRSIPR